jgi:NAD(P)-dependent dehydrogenase (short-subunit alcohol dehydrogenase family)
VYADTNQTIMLGRTSTAKDVVDAYGGAGAFAGKTAVITGGASGIGLETAKALALAGCKVIICSRDPTGYAPRCEQAVLEGGEYQVPNAMLEHKFVDLENLVSVRDLASELASEPRIDFLVLNAGVMAIPQRETTPAGFEKTIGINHFAHQLFFQLLEPKLRASAESCRVVVLASGAHMRGGLDLTDLRWEKRKYEPWSAYGASKLANILFAKELSDRAAGTPLSAVSLHPGVIQTPLWRHIDPSAAASMAGGKNAKSIEQGAATTVYACLTPNWTTEGFIGGYLADCKLSRPDRTGEDEDGSLRKALWKATEAQLAEAGFALP